MVIPEVFVGRESELATLRTAIEETRSGSGKIVFVVGEPGIGKTRLAEEAATIARARGVGVLWGRCWEGGGAPAFWPWSRIIRQCVQDRSAEQVQREMGPGASDIAEVVAEVRTRLPDLPPSPPATFEPEQGKFRFFDSLSTFHRNTAAAQPLMLVLDDLHRADRASLALMEFLAPDLRESRVLLLGTYRDGELGADHRLAESTAAVCRQPMVESITLRGLNESDVARCVEHATGPLASAANVAAIL
jgi:predicted ATPase